MTRNPSIAAVLISAIISVCLSGSGLAADSSTIHTIGIASTCGHFFTLQHVGGTKLDTTAADEEPVDDWGIDDMIAASVNKALGDHYATKVLSVEAHAIMPTPGSLFSTHPDPDLLREALKDSGSFDAYVLVWPALRKFGDTNVDLSGIGLFQQEVFGHVRSPRLFTVCNMSLVDGHTFAVMGQEMLLKPYKSNSLFNAVRTVATLESGTYFQSIAPAAWADSVEAITPPQKQMILDSLSKLLDDEMPATLQRTKVIP